MKCTNCGYENPQGARFCGKCGLDLMVNHTEGRKKKEETKNRRKNSTESMQPAKKKGKKIAILLLSVCVLIAVAIAAYLSVMSHPEKRYEKTLKTAQKYMEEENYDQAIAKYKQAISIDPKQVEPYRQLAKAYIATENSDAVEETYDTVTGIIVQEYKNTGAVLDGTKDVYKDKIDYYGKTGDTEKIKTAADEVVGMLDDAKDKNEVEQLRDFYLMNWGYYNKLQELEKSQGEADFTSETDEMGTFISCSGLCFAKLVDFNNDGQEELVVAYQMSDGSKYVEEVYGYEEDEVHKLLFGDGFVTAGVHDTTKISVLSKDDQFYLIDGKIIDLYEKDIIYGYQNDSFEKLKTIGTTGFDAVYSVDDRTVSESTYTSACEKWLDSDKIQNYALSDYGTESIITSIEELKNVYETLRKRLNIQVDTREDDVIQRLKDVKVSEVNVQENVSDSTDTSTTGTDIDRELTEIEEKAAEIEERLSNAMDQTTMNQTSAELRKLWDDELNSIWSRLKTSLDADAMEQLKNEENDWIKYKDSEIEKVGQEYEGGSMRPMEENMTGADLTRDRVYVLKDYL